MASGKNIALCTAELDVLIEGQEVLKNIHVDIPAGVMCALIGPNGAGKSSLVKAILGLQSIQKGSEVKFFGKSFKEMKDQIAYVQQRKDVDWQFPISVREVVAMGRYPHLGFLKRLKPNDKTIIDEVLDQVGLTALADRQIGQLSGGEQQRAFVARAIVQDPQLYLLDEPFVGIDAPSEKLIIAVLQALKSKGKTIVIVHHDLQTLAQYFDWVVMLNKAVITQGATIEVYNDENIARTFGFNTSDIP